MQRALWLIGTAYLAAVLSLGCDGGNASPSLRSATPLAPSSQPVSSSFTVSGVVTEYRLGPLSGVTMRARPNSAPPPWLPDDPRIKTTLTGVNGFYRIEGLTEPIIVDAMRDGFEPSGFGAFTGDRVVNITLNRRLWIAGGETLNATIWGDSELSGEDWTGANCDHKACTMIHVTTPSSGVLTTTLKWSGQAAELGVFISTGFFSGQGAYGSSPLETSLEIRGGETLVVVSLEKSSGARPTPQSNQAFELATTFKAR